MRNCTDVITNPFKNVAVFFSPSARQNEKVKQMIHLLPSLMPMGGVVLWKMGDSHLGSGNGYEPKTIASYTFTKATANQVIGEISRKINEQSSIFRKVGYQAEGELVNNQAQVTVQLSVLEKA